MPRPDERGRVALLALIVGLVLGLVVAWRLPAAPLRTGLEWLERPRPVPVFALQTDSGAWTRESLKGHWTLVLFGYTRCPDVCPTSLAQLAVLAAAAPRQSVRYAFVSVDPEHDDPARLGRYARAFSPDFLGATGEPAMLARLAGALGVRFAVDGSAVGHSVTVSLIDPAGRMRARLRPGFDVDTVARELARL